MDRFGVLERLGQWQTRLRIPHPRRFVQRPRHDPLAIRTELGANDRFGMFERLGQWLARLRIPHLRRVVRRSRHDPLAIQTELGGQDPSSVSERRPSKRLHRGHDPLQ